MSLLENEHDKDYELEQVQALNKILIECNKTQVHTIRHFKNILITLLVCVTISFCAMIAGFFWYESQFDTTETTTTELSTEGDNADINSVTNGDMYNDSSTHNE